MINKRILLLSTLSSISSICAIAQMDNVVEVENNFKPTVKDANKINILPGIEETQVNHYNVDYTTTAVPTTNYAFQPMWADNNKQLICSDKKGFATLGYGTNDNTIGRIAYGFDLNMTDELNVEFSSRGHKGEIDHIDGQDKWNSRFFTNRLKAGYVHKLSPKSALIIDASYGTDVFNYQPTSSAVNTPNGTDIIGKGTDKQHNNLIDFNTVLTPYFFGKFNIKAEANFYNFRQRYLTCFADKATENLLNAKITPGFRISKKMAVDVQLEIEHTNYGMNGVEGYTLFNAIPHVFWQNNALDICAGIYVNNKSEIAPDINFTIHLLPNMDIYLKANGGNVRNDFRHFAQMSPYWALHVNTNKIEYQFDRLSARGGIRIRPTDGLYADISTGYVVSKNRAELDDYYMSTYYPTYTPIMFADGKQFFANIDLKYSYQHIMNVDFNTQYNVWSTDYNTGTDISSDILWRPVVDTDLKIELQPIKRLIVGADFIYQSFKDKANRYDRPSTVNLGATLSYTFPCKLSIYAKGNNLLNKKYDEYTMYRTTGANFLFGVAYTF